MRIDIPRQLKRTLWVMLALALLAATGCWVYKVEVRDEQRRIAALEARAKVQTLAETMVKLKKAAESFKSKKAEVGMPLPPGKIISLEELEDSRVLRKEELEGTVRIDKFSYLILPDEAPGQTIQMVLITDKGRATMKKSGEGSLYEK